MSQPQYPQQLNPIQRYYNPSNIHTTDLQQFHEHICGCLSDTDSCIMSFICPCIQEGRSAHVLDPTEPVWYISMLWCILELCVGLGCCLGTYHRYRLRQYLGIDYGIRNSVLGDCGYHFILPCCAISQQTRELKYRLHNGIITVEQLQLQHNTVHDHTVQHAIDIDTIQQHQLHSSEPLPPMSYTAQQQLSVQSINATGGSILYSDQSLLQSTTTLASTEVTEHDRLHEQSVGRSHQPPIHTHTPKVYTEQIEP